MIRIPKTKTVVRNQMTGDCLHYELQEDKCTKRLVVYKCLENGCLESWRKADFIVRQERG